MTVDIEKLEALAKAATKGEWSTSGSYISPTRKDGGTTYVESWRSIALVHGDADRSFIAAANPAAVLELIADNERLRNLAQSEIDKAGESAKEVMGARMTLHTLEQERNQLKAELAGLKTGYEAYERVNAELRAECEALRKPLLAAREFIMHESEVRGLLDENNEVSFRHPRRQATMAAIDAVMSKEQSHD